MGGCIVLLFKSYAHTGVHDHLNRCSGTCIFHIQKKSKDPPPIFQNAWDVFLHKFHHMQYHVIPMEGRRVKLITPNITAYVRASGYIRLR